MATGDKGGAVASRPLKPRERTALVHAVARIKTAERAHAREVKQQDFLRRRAAALRQTQEDVLHRKITPIQGHARLQQMGFVPGGASFKNPRSVPGFAAKVAGDLASAAYYSPAGVAHIAGAVKGDVGSTVHGKPTVRRTAGVGKELAKATGQDFAHPLRHPGLLGLDVLGAASLGVGAAARGAAAAGELGAEGSALARAGRAGAALAKRRPPIHTHVQVNDLKVRVPLSRNPLTAAVQKHRLGSLKGDRLARRVGHLLQEERRVTESIQRLPAERLAAAGRKLSTPEQIALRAVAEETPIQSLLDYHNGRLAELKGQKPTVRLERARHRKLVKQIAKAKDLVKETGGRLTLADEKLARIYLETKAVAKTREALLLDIGKLTPQAVAGRVSAPGKLIRGETLAKAAAVEPPHPGQLSLIDEPTPSGFAGGDFRVPSTERVAARSLGRHGSMGTGGSIGVPQTPGSLTHGYTGALRRTGRERQDVTKLVAESNLEAQRYGALLRLRDRLKSAAVDTPPNDQYIPIRLDSLKRHEPLPNDVRALLEKRKLSPVERARLEHEYLSLLDSLFLKHPDTSAEARTRFAELAQQGKVAWVHRGLLKGLNQQRLLGAAKAYLNEIPGVAGTAARGTAALIPEINAAFKLSILYLKPAYLIPNALGNAALTMIQQGFAAPRNLVHAVRLSHEIGKEGAAEVDALVGEGATRSLLDAHGGPASRLIQPAASFWSKGVDVPFRRASFLYEARQAGFRTPEALDRLLHDKAHEPDLVEVTQRANRALIDYGRLGPVERDVIRHVVFFYPWVKGSTLYAGHFLAEHPAQAAALGTAGQVGKERARRDLGPVPSFAEGIFKTGQRGKLPLVSNPASATIFGTPAQIGRDLAATATGNYKPGYSLSQQLTPALSSLLTLLTHKDPFTGADVHGSLPSILARQFVQASPIALLHERATMSPQARAKKMYPLTGSDAAKQFLLGTIAPRPYNPAVGQKLAAKETAPTGRAGLVYRHEQAAKGLPRQARLLASKGVLPNATVPRYVARGFELARDRDLAYWDAAHKLGVKTADLSPQQKAKLELDVAKKAGTIPANVAATATRVFEHTPPEQMRNLSREFWREYGYGQYVSEWKSYVRHYQGAAQ